VKPEDFDLFSSIVKQRSGLVLTREKAYLLESRLLPVARKYNLKLLEDMANMIRTKRDEAMLNAITEAMTTNESSATKNLLYSSKKYCCRNCWRHGRQKNTSASGRQQPPAGRKPIRWQ